MDNETCNRLLMDIKEGDMQSFSELYLTLFKPVYAFVLGITGNTDLSADITQDVFIKIRFNINKYHIKHNPLGWIFTIAKNTAIDYLRMSRIRQGKAPQSDIGGIDQNDVDTTIIINDILKNLSGGERKIIFLRFVAGFNQKEIARLLKLPVSTVNWRYRKAIDKLADFLREEDLH